MININVRFFILLGCLTSSFIAGANPSPSQGMVGLSAAKLSGAAQFSGRFDLKPSGLKDHNSFLVDFLSMNFMIPNRVDIIGKLQLGPDRDATTGQYQLLVQSLYLNYENFFSERDQLWVGVFPIGSSRFFAEFWSELEVYGSQSLRHLENFKYTSPSDLGVSYRAWWGERLTWSIGLINGEGRDSAEAGLGKDFSLNFEYLSSPSSKVEAQWVWGLGAISGRYDGVAESMAQKQRTGVWISRTKSEGVSFGFEMYSTVDPVDKINQKVADKVDLTSYGGTIVRGEGGSFLTRFTPQSKAYTLFLKLDTWNPAKDISEKWIRSELVGFSVEPAPGTKFSVTNNQSQYGLDHSSTVRDQEFWLMTVNQAF